MSSRYSRCESCAPALFQSTSYKKLLRSVDMVPRNGLWDVNGLRVRLVKLRVTWPVSSGVVGVGQTLVLDDDASRSAGGANFDWKLRGGNWSSVGAACCGSSIASSSCVSLLRLAWGTTSTTSPYGHQVSCCSMLERTDRYEQLPNMQHITSGFSTHRHM